MGAHPEHYTFSSGKLRLKATPVNLDNSKESPIFVGRRQEHIDFTATTSMRLQKASAGDETGLTVYMFNLHTMTFSSNSRKTGNKL